MELFLLYLWLKLDTLMGIFTGIMVASLIMLVFTFIAWVIYSIHRMEDEGDTWVEAKAHPTHRALTKFRNTLVVVAAVTGLIGNLIPTQKETAVLVGGHFALQAAQSPEAAKVVSVLRKKANEFLDEQLADKPKEKK